MFLQACTSDLEEWQLAMVQRWRSVRAVRRRGLATAESFRLYIASVLGAGVLLKLCSLVGESKVNFDGSLPEAEWARPAVAPTSPQPMLARKLHQAEHPAPVRSSEGRTTKPSISIGSLV